MTGDDSEALADSRTGRLTLAPLDLAAVREVAAPYAPAQADEDPDEWLLDERRRAAPRARDRRSAGRAARPRGG